MQASEQPVLRDVVLLGVGHSHVGVLRRFAMNPLPRLRLNLICSDSHTPQSGMLPGYVAGHYAFDEVHIDLDRLCVFAGVRYFRTEAIGIDRAARRVLCGGRPPIECDLLSINIGSTPQTVQVPGADEFAVPGKPIRQFIERWLALPPRVRRQPGRTTMAVVGGGAGWPWRAMACHERLGRGRVVGVDQTSLLLRLGEAVVARAWHGRQAGEVGL